MEALLKVEGLTKTYNPNSAKEITALKDVSFSLFPKETLGIVGESGSGKSTLAKVLMRLTDSEAGEFFLHHKNFTKSKGKELRNFYQDVQMIFQSPAGSFDPKMTLGASIAESLKNKGMSGISVSIRVQELLKLCGLDPDLAYRLPSEVSGGQCQRAAIARALAVEPKVLICDEITSALDVSVQAKIVDLLIKIQASTGISYIFISHDLALIQQICQRVLVMRKGEVVEEGETDQVIMSPKSSYTQKLIDAVLY